MFSASLGLGTLESCLLLFSLLLCHFFHPLLQREEGPLQTQNHSCHWRISPICGRKTLKSSFRRNNQAKTSQSAFASLHIRTENDLSNDGNAKMLTANCWALDGRWSVSQHPHTLDQLPAHHRTPFSYSNPKHPKKSQSMLMSQRKT